MYSLYLGTSIRVGNKEKVSLLLDTMSMILIEIFVFERLLIQRTKPWRTDQKKQLLLRYVNPHKEVYSSTISGWIIKVLNLAGIHTSVFKEHSSHSAASSGAELAGALISGILSMGSWSDESLRQKFCNKHVPTPEVSFQKKLLLGNK